MPFKEGAEVKQGDLLFEVDPRPYQAQYDQAVGQVNLYKAQLELAKANFARDKEVAKTPGAVSVQQLDQDKAAVDEADAAVKAFQASLEVYKLNLSFTKVTSPIAGQVSRYYLTLGNLVVQDQTLLTTVVSLDPMYIYFDVDEGTVIRARHAINTGAIKK
jgi:membrane fusion protein, multidrug efflux system